MGRCLKEANTIRCAPFTQSFLPALNLNVITGVLAAVLDQEAILRMEARNKIGCKKKEEAQVPDDCGHSIPALDCQYPSSLIWASSLIFYCIGPNLIPTDLPAIFYFPFCDRHKVQEIVHFALGSTVRKNITASLMRNGELPSLRVKKWKGKAERWWKTRECIPYTLWEWSPPWASLVFPQRQRVPIFEGT